MNLESKLCFMAITILLLSAAFFVTPGLSQDGLVGHWSFDEPSNLTMANVGTDLVLVGSHAPAKDPEDKDSAINIDNGSYYILPHGIASNGGGNKVNEYTFVMDILLPELNEWHTIYQTDPTNSSDGEVFINPTGHVGVGATGYTGPALEAHKWYRMAVVVKNGSLFNYYIDGFLVLSGAPGTIDGRFSLGSTVLLFADENGEDNNIIVNDIKLFSRALSSAEIKALGGYDNITIDIPISAANFMPYLQSPTPNSIYVCWHDPGTTESIVEYGESESLGNTQTGSIHQFDGATVWHWVKLTDLRPETVYYYKVYGDTTESEIFKFKTPPEYGKKDGHIRFGVIGDNRTEPDVYTRTIVNMKEKMIELYGQDIEDNINLVLNVGDIVTSGGVLSQYAREYFTPISSLSHTIPFMVSIGNHEREAQNYYNYMKYEDFGGPQGERYFSFKYGRVLFVSINSNYQLHNATQIEWLDSLLSNAQQDSTIDWIISFCHHPGHSELWPDGNTVYIQDLVIPTLNKYSKADIIMYGHSHNYERGTVPDGNLRLLLQGGAGSNLDRWGMYGNQQNYPEIQKSFDHYGYTIFDIDIANKRYTAKSYSFGHTNIFFDNLLIDEFYRDKKDETQPDKPALLSPEAGTEVASSVLLKASSFTGSHPFMSSQFQVTKNKGDYSTPYMNVIRDFEDIFWDDGTVDYTPIDLNVDVDLTEIQFESKNEKPGTKFWWRVRYRDKNVQWSEWSEEKSFSLQKRTDSGEPNDSPQTASTLFIADSLSASFESASDVDWYRFYFDALCMYYFTSIESTPGVEPGIELYHESDLTTNMLSTSVSGLNDAGDFRLAGFFPSKAGYYYAKVTNTKANTGNYKIRLVGGRSTKELFVNEFDNSPSGIMDKPAFLPNDTLAAAIFPKDDADYYRIEGQQGWWFEVGTTPVYGLGNRDTDTFITLFDESQNQLYENDNRGEETTPTGETQENTFSRIQGVFPYTGLYFLKVRSRYNADNSENDEAHPFLGEYGVYFKTSQETGIELDESYQTPTTYQLYQNYPNPFNPETQVKFDLPKNSHVIFKVYDVMGREIQTLRDSELQAGIHAITWNGTNVNGEHVTSGIYIIRMSTPEFSKSIKVTLLR